MTKLTELKQFIEKQIKSCDEEISYSGTFTSVAWSHKKDAYEEILKMLNEYKIIYGIY